MTERNMNLLDFYKEHVQIDPEVTQEEITENLNLANCFQEGFDYLYHVFETTLSNLQNYKMYKESGFPEYFKSVSGNKVVKVGSYIGVLDLWYPREVNMFNLTHNPICAGWVIQDLLGRMERIEDIIKFPNPSQTLTESIGRLLNKIKGTEFYGFWMGDTRNSGRKRSIKIRRLEVTKIELPDVKYYYSSLYPEMVMRDKDTREEIVFSQYNLDGWSFYLSKELLADRLNDLESFWMRGYDDKIRALDYEVKVKKKELENLINRRSEFENGITEYKKKLHRLLWKSF